MEAQKTNHQGITILLIAVIVSLSLIGWFFHTKKVNELKIEKEVLKKEVQSKEISLQELKSNLLSEQVRIDSLTNIVELQNEEKEYLKAKSEYNEKLKLINLYTVAAQQRYFDSITGKTPRTAVKTNTGNGSGQRSGK